MSTTIVRSLAVVWLVLFLASFAVLIATQPTGDGFARGLNRIAAFLTWQGAALVLATICAFVTYRFGGAGGKRGKAIGYAPLGASVLILGLVLAIIAFRLYVQPVLA